MKILFASVFLLLSQSFGQVDDPCDSKTKEECSAYYDSLALAAEAEMLAKIPDSLKITLKRKLETDTSFVFYGHLIKNEYLVSPWILERQSDIKANEDDVKIFKEWYESETKSHEESLKALPKNIRDIYESDDLRTNYHLEENVYEIEKIYDRSSQSWVSPDKEKSVYSVKKLKRAGARISPDTSVFLWDEYADPGYKRNRIFFRDGFSMVLQPEQLEKLSEIENDADTYIPEFWTFSLAPNKIPLLKKQMAEAVSQNNRKLLGDLWKELDSLVQNKPEMRMKGDSLDFERCETKSLLNAYLGNYENVEICEKPTENPWSDGFSEECKLDSLLEDYFEKSIENGTFEKSLEKLDASRRSVIRIVIQSFIGRERAGRIYNYSRWDSLANQDNRLNDVVEIYADSVEDEETRDRLIRSYYKKVRVSSLNGGGSVGGIFGFPLDSGKNLFPESLNARFEVNFFYKNFAFGMGFRSFDVTKSGDSLSGVFLDGMFGYRTNISPYIDNIILTGPSLFAYQPKDDSYEVDNSLALGWFISSAFDFYFCKHNLKPMTFENYRLRLGVRVAAGLSFYSINESYDVANTNAFVSLGFIIQGYGCEPVPYRARK